MRLGALGVGGPTVEPGRVCGGVIVILLPPVVLFVAGIGRFPPNRGLGGLAGPPITEAALRRGRGAETSLGSRVWSAWKNFGCSLRSEAEDEGE